LSPGFQDIQPGFGHAAGVPRKTRITKITIETHRRVVIRKPSGQTDGDTGAAGEIVERLVHKDNDPADLRPHKETKPND
jgi:hypothetical protein